jgi:PleD family two-component response regulator
MSDRKLRILIVDDSPEDREYYRRLLNRAIPEGFVGFEAESGEDGLKSAQSMSPDCVLLDFNLPDIDGLEFIVRLRGALALRCVAVVMLTGQGDERVAVETMKRGAQDYLIKGDLTTSALSRAVRSAVATTSLARRLQAEHGDLEQQVQMAKHDLGPPIRAIESTVELLAVHANERGDEISSAYADDLRRSAADVRCLVEALGDYARIDLSRTAAKARE